MAMQFVMPITFLLLLTFGLAEAALSMAKTNCKSWCRNLEIPPVGIGPNCYLDKAFEVVCNGSGAFLTGVDMEVRQINISAYYQYTEESYRTNNPTIQVQMPIIYSKTCTSTTTSTRSDRRINFKGSPFFFSESRNAFISVGCENFAIMADIAPTVFGCTSDCTTNMKIESGGLTCKGFNCCKSTNVPSNLQVFAVDFRSRNESKVRDPAACKYAFLADQDWLATSIPDPSFVQYWDI